jgi:hypothetical protein
MTGGLSSEESSPASSGSAMLGLRRHRGDYLRQLLASREAEKDSLRVEMKSTSTTPMDKKAAFTRYTSVIMDMRKIERDLNMLTGS